MFNFFLFNKWGLGLEIGPNPLYSSSFLKYLINNYLKKIKIKIIKLLKK